MVDFNDSADGVAARPAPAADSGLGREWFQAPNPGAGIQGTTVKNDFLNDVWGSFKQLLLAAGITPVRGAAGDAQVRDAVLFLSSALVNTHAAQISSESLAAHLETAAPGEVRNLANSSRVVTPLNLPDAWRHGAAAGSTDSWSALPASFMARWQQHPTRPVPGGGAHLVLTEQWGVTPESAPNVAQFDITFPIPFSGTNYTFQAVLVDQFDGAGSRNTNILANSIRFESAGAVPSTRAMWRAVGFAPIQP